ncbi:MAG: hypothetical protein GEU88_17420 [Solirubrobacterales bacterium]|nr:hypothetical protein [Solirubrobacterales bacterium]
MRNPYYFLHGNLVFGRGPKDVWAAYRLIGQSYTGLALAGKLELKEQLEGFAYAVATDFQLIRASREWSVDQYVERALAVARGDERLTAEFERVTEGHRELLAGERVVRPEILLLVRLGAPRYGASNSERLGDLFDELAAALRLRRAEGMGRKSLAQLRPLEARLFDRVTEYMPCERARSGEVATLIRSAYTRGVGEPRVDPNWQPQALIVDDEGGFEPYGHDLLRLHDCPVEIAARSLVVHSEAGVGHQAALVVGALPDETRFPGPAAELMFASLELDFPVDAVLACETIPNRLAEKLAKKRLVDADQQAKEEGFGEHGPAPATLERTSAAREALQRLGGSDRAPLLRSALTVVVGAPDAEELERRIDRLRDSFRGVELYRPSGDQHRLFMGAMPAQPHPTPEYKMHLLPEQVGAMVPTAISHAGTEIGPLLGFTLTGSRQPVLFDIAAAARENRPPTVLLTGSLGSGKTATMQLLLYLAFLSGARCVDIDPKGHGDHAWLALPEVAERTERITLGEGERFAGLLDPFRIAPQGAQKQVAMSFLFALLPEPIPPEWRTEITRAVNAIAERERGCVGDMLLELGHGGESGKQTATAIEVHLGAGIAQLGFGRSVGHGPEVGDAQVTALEIRNLNLPEAGTARGEMEDDERIAQSVLRLIAAYARRLCETDEREHAVYALDEAWALLGDSQGAALMRRLSRMGRSLRITPILASQIVGDTKELEPLVGNYFSFHVETDEEAARALRLLRLDPDDEALRQRLMSSSFRRGDCFFRDFDGRVVPLHVELGEDLLAALRPDHDPLEEPQPSDAPPAASPDDNGGGPFVELEDEFDLLPLIEGPDEVA